MGGRSAVLQQKKIEKVVTMIYATICYNIPEGFLFWPMLPSSSFLLHIDIDKNGTLHFLFQKDDHESF